MNQKTLLNVNRFGKTGKIVMNFLLIVTCLLTLLCGVAAVTVKILPDDAIQAHITNQAEIIIHETIFPSVWRMFTQNASYTTNDNPSEILKKNMVPQENTEISGKMKFLNQSYSSAMVQSDKDNKVIYAKSSPEVYHLSDFATVLVLATIFLMTLVGSFWMMRNVFCSLSTCESPFNLAFTLNLKKFAYSLLPLTLFSSIGETMAIRFLSAGNVTDILIQWGLLVAFIITMFLVKVFQYGVLLQKESDETL